MQLSWQNQHLNIKSKTCTVAFTDDYLQINNFKIIDSGEYEIGGVGVVYNNGRYLFHIENTPVALLPTWVNGSTVTPDEFDELSQADILIVKINQFDEKTKKDLTDLISKIDPKCFIALCTDEQICQPLVKEFDVEPVNDVKITSIDLPEEGRNTILMVCPKNNSSN